MSNYMPLDFATWIRQAYREPESTSFTIHNMEVAYQAGRAFHVPAPAPAREAPVAVLKFERGIPGRGNEMPRVVSCNWMPDGEYKVYLAAAPYSAKQDSPVGTQQPAPISTPLAGWRLVPLEPTGEMLEATYAGQHCSDVYRDMLAAAPRPSPAAQGDALDAERLDWLALAGPVHICLVIDRERDGEIELSTDDVTGYGKTLREAIDAARAAQEDAAPGECRAYRAGSRTS